MRFLFALLLALPLAARAAAPVATNIANFPSVSVHYTNYLAEGIVTNGLTLGGVRMTNWPSGGIAGTVIATGTPVVGDLLSASDTSGTNGVWASRSFTNTAPGTASAASGVTNLVLPPGFLVAGGTPGYNAGTNGLVVFPDGTGLWNIDPYDPARYNSDAIIFTANMTNTDFSLSPGGFGFNTWAFDSGSSLIVGTNNGYAFSVAATLWLKRPFNESPIDFSGGSFPNTDYGIYGTGLSESHGIAASVGNAGGSSGVGVGVLGLARGQSSISIGTAGISKIGATNVIGGYFSTYSANQNLDPSVSAVILANNRDSGLPLIVCLTNSSSQVFAVAPSGLTTANAGFSSTATDSLAVIAATGWTNSFGKNAVVRFDGTAMTYVVYNNAGTAQYTNAVSVGHATELLQTGGKLIITAGTGVSGTASPF